MISGICFADENMTQKVSRKRAVSGGGKYGTVSGSDRFGFGSERKL
jgi:hypothetical protein